MNIEESPTNPPEKPENQRLRIEQNSAKQRNEISLSKNEELERYELGSPSNRAKLIIKNHSQLSTLTLKTYLKFEDWDIVLKLVIEILDNEGYSRQDLVYYEIGDALKKCGKHKNSQQTYYDYYRSLF